MLDGSDWRNPILWNGSMMNHMWLDGQLLDGGADIGGSKVSAHFDAASSQATTGNAPRLLHAVDGKKLSVKSPGGVVPMARRHKCGTQPALEGAPVRC